MTDEARNLLENCETLMLDMDGTILDLAFDNFMWREHVPARYAEQRSMSIDEARNSLYTHFVEMQGRLEWYCLDYWSDLLKLDIAGLHREQSTRIGYLPGAEAFLEQAKQSGVTLLLVTNSHAETLAIKHEATGVQAWFDGVYSSHSFGVPKETPAFWAALSEAESFDPETTVFIDDTVSVLESAARFGLGGLIEITQPDTSRPVRNKESYTAVEGLRSLL